MVIGITGHQRLEDESAWSWAADVIRSALARIPASPIGISSLAIGADQLFAKLILEQGGELQVVQPFPAYAETFTTGKDLESYQALLGRAASVEILPELANREESYLAAGQRVVDLSDRMIALWNGKKAAGLGGTGDIVQYALERNREVLHINPVSREIKNLTPGG